MHTWALLEPKLPLLPRPPSSMLYAVAAKPTRKSFLRIAPVVEAVPMTALPLATVMVTVNSSVSSAMSSS